MNQRVMVKFTKLQAFYYHHHEICCKVAKKGMGVVENSWKKQDPNSGDIDGDDFFFTGQFYYWNTKSYRKHNSKLLCLLGNKDCENCRSYLPSTS